MQGLAKLVTPGDEASVAPLEPQLQRDATRTKNACNRCQYISVDHRSICYNFSMHNPSLPAPKSNTNTMALSAQTTPATHLGPSSSTTQKPRSWLGLLTVHESIRKEHESGFLASRADTAVETRGSTHSASVEAGVQRCHPDSCKATGRLPRAYR